MFNEEMTSKIQPATVVLVVKKKKSGGHFTRFTSKNYRWRATLAIWRIFAELDKPKRTLSTFVGYEELSRSRRVLASVDNTLLDLLHSSYATQPHSLIAK